MNIAQSNITQSIITFNKQQTTSRDALQTRQTRQLSIYADQCKADRTQSVSKTQDTYDLLYSNLPTAQLKSQFDTIIQQEQPVDEYESLDLMFKFWIDNYAVTGFTSELQAFVFFSTPGNLTPNSPCVEPNTAFPTVAGTPAPTSAMPVSSPTFYPSTSPSFPISYLDCNDQPVEWKHTCWDIVSMQESGHYALTTYNIDFELPNSADLELMVNSLYTSPSSMVDTYNRFDRASSIIEQSRSKIYKAIPEECQLQYDGLFNQSVHSRFADMNSFMQRCGKPIEESFVRHSTSSSASNTPIGYMGIEFFNLSVAVIVLLYLARRVALNHTQSYKPFEKKVVGCMTSLSQKSEPVEEERSIRGDIELQVFSNTEGVENASELSMETCSNDTYEPQSRGYYERISAGLSTAGSFFMDGIRGLHDHSPFGMRSLLPSAESTL